MSSRLFNFHVDINCANNNDNDTFNFDIVKNMRTNIYIAFFEGNQTDVQGIARQF